MLCRSQAEESRKVMASRKSKQPKVHMIFLGQFHGKFLYRGMAQSNNSRNNVRPFQLNRYRVYKLHTLQRNYTVRYRKAAMGKNSVQLQQALTQAMVASKLSSTIKRRMRLGRWSMATGDITLPTLWRRPRIANRISTRRFLCRTSSMAILLCLPEARFLTGLL